MKIRSDRLEGFLPQEQTQKVAIEGKAFEEMLAQQLVQGQTSGQTAPLGGMQKIDPLLLGGVDVEATEEDAMLAGLFLETDELLSAWENYAKSLGSGQDKAAWSLLAGLDSRVKSVRGELGQMGERGNGLDGVLNELEVLTATEKFKFNRGDYQ